MPDTEMKQTLFQILKEFPLSQSAAPIWGMILPYTPISFRDIWQYLETFLSPLGVGI